MYVSLDFFFVNSQLRQRTSVFYDGSQLSFTYNYIIRRALSQQFLN